MAPKKMQRIGKGPKVFVQVMAEFGSAGHDTVDFAKVQKSLNALGYELSKTNGALMTVREANTALNRAKSWLAEQVMLDPSLKVPMLDGMEPATIHRKPRGSKENPDEYWKGDEEFKQRKERFEKHKELVIEWLFEREDGQGFNLPTITISGDQFESHKELYLYLAVASGSTKIVFE